MRLVYSLDYALRKTGEKAAIAHYFVVVEFIYPLKASWQVELETNLGFMY